MHKKQHISIFPQASLKLKGLLWEWGLKKPLLVTGKNSYYSSGADRSLRDTWNKLRVTHFNDFHVNPDSQDVEKGIDIFLKSDCDCIVSVGGGSVIDMAKLINYYSTSTPLQIDINSLNNPQPQLVKHIAIPTTAGSGAESTHFAVLYIGKDKFSVAHPNLLPDAVLIDPLLHYAQSTYQKAVSGIDALAQAIESLWSVNRTEESTLYAQNALRLLWNSLPKAVQKGDPNAHLETAEGANWAGRAINITKTTAPHALSYGFTTLANLPHGHAVALSLPYFLELHTNPKEDAIVVHPGGTPAVKESMKEIFETIPSLKKIENLFAFYSQLGIITDPHELNLTPAIFENVIAQVNIERLSNNPVQFNPKKLLKYYLNDLALPPISA